MKSGTDAAGRVLAPVNVVASGNKAKLMKSFENADGIWGPLPTSCRAPGGVKCRRAQKLACYFLTSYFLSREMKLSVFNSGIEKSRTGTG